MPKTPYANLYETLQKELDRDPHQSVPQLCKKYNASYTGFKFWRKKQNRAQPRTQTRLASPNNTTQLVTIQLSLEDLARDFFKDEERVCHLIKTTLDHKAIASLIYHIGKQANRRYTYDASRNKKART